MQEILITVVDFGSKKLSASLGKETEIDVEIIGSENVLSKGGVRKGLIYDKDTCKEALIEVIKKLEGVSNERVNDIYVGISSNTLRAFEVEGSIELNPKKIEVTDKKQVIENAKHNLLLEDDEEIVDYLINFYTLDGKIIEDDVVDYIGNILEVNITYILGKTKELKKFKEIIYECGYNFKGFIVNIISGKNVFLYDRKTIGTNAIIDIGAEITDIAIYNNGMLKYISSIPLGGDNVTRDISICGNCSIVEAENLKKIYSKNYESMHKKDYSDSLIEVEGVKISKELFYEVIKARLEEIIKFVSMELKKSSFYDGICSIIIYGDGIIGYENINFLVKNQIEKKCKVINKDELGMDGLENISSLSGVKEVYDKLKLLNKKDLVNEEEFNTQHNLINEFENKDNSSEEFDYYYEKKKKPNGVMAKIKKFLKL